MSEQWAHDWAVEYERLKLAYVEAVLAANDPDALTDSDAADRAERKLDAFVMRARRQPTPADTPDGAA